MLDSVRSPALRAILLFALAGPLIGASPFVLLFTIVGFHLKDGPLIGLLPLIFGFVLGLPLALLAGCIFAATNSLTKGASTIFWVRSTFSGAASGLLAATLIIALFPDTPVNKIGDKTPNPNTILYVASILAGGACGVMFSKHRQPSSGSRVEA
jgi:hypothetical protein